MRNYMMPTPPVAIALNGSDCWTIHEEHMNARIRNRVFPVVIWLRPPSPELRTLVLSRGKMFPERDRREEWLCPKPGGVP